MSGALDSDRVLVTALAKGEDDDALLDAWFKGGRRQRTLVRRGGCLPVPPLDDEAALTPSVQRSGHNPCHTMPYEPRRATTCAIVSPPGNGAAVKRI
jgi:hypothetical protein